MKTSIYEILFCRQPQTLIDLDHYQKHWFDCNIKAPVPADPPPVTLNTHVESSEEIGQLMRQSPSRSRGG